jgi:dTMP kinase
LIREVVELATAGLRPDLTLIFDLPVSECVARARRRVHDGHKGDRLDSEDVEFHTRVRDAYLEIAREEPERVRIVDASGSIDETHARVLDIIMPVIKSRES